MVSPVDTSVKWAHHSMPGAPILKTQVGSLIAVLDAVLVDGWGVQTATSVVVAAGVAEATFPADHAAAPHSVVLVAGITGAMTGLNGEQKITTVAPNKIRWATALPDGTATGTATVKMAAAGWEKAFTGTNLAVYRSLDPQSAKMCLRVDDRWAGYARVIGYETMTSVSAGAGPFPVSGQISGGGYWNKGGAASSFIIPWAIFSDGGFLHIPILADAYLGPDYAYSELYNFGDIVTAAPTTDPYSTLISVSSAAYTTGSDTTGAGPGASSSGLFVARACTGVLGAKNVGAEYKNYTNTPLFPDRISGGMWALPAPMLAEDGVTGSGVLAGYRGTIPGMRRASARGASAVLGAHAVLIVDGKAMMLQDYGGTTTIADCSVLYDLTGPWR